MQKFSTNFKAIPQLYLAKPGCTSNWLISGFTFSAFLEGLRHTDPESGLVLYRNTIAQRIGTVPENKKNTCT